VFLVSRAVLDLEALEQSPFVFGWYQTDGSVSKFVAAEGKISLAAKLTSAYERRATGLRKLSLVKLICDLANFTTSDPITSACLLQMNEYPQ
jgi:hypothetical protein